MDDQNNNVFEDDGLEYVDAYDDYISKKEDNSTVNNDELEESGYSLDMDVQENADNNCDDYCYDESDGNDCDADVSYGYSCYDEDYCDDGFYDDDYYDCGCSFSHDEPGSFLRSKGYDADYLDFRSDDEKYEIARNYGIWWDE